VIRGEKTSDEAVATVYVLARSLGKTPVVVRDRPGFLVNRILAPYLDEAAQLVADGASVEAVDRSLVRFGMPMGPLTLYDQVGIDIASHVAAILTDAFGERLGDASLLTPLVEAGRLGKKAGVGFYRHEGGKPQPDPEAESLVRAGRPTARRAPGPDEIVERCILRMIDEGARCLEEGVVRDAEDLDLAMVFGTGFPPFRGGLMRHADALGPRHVAERLESLASTHGIRFQPSERLRQVARDGTSFRKPIID
jgi:3-hydroxyacyl-CoA dehydrogenase / enoyl-CoA hydratase / 3-hydroxybutyryl-CoA epimerase